MHSMQHFQEVYDNAKQWVLEAGQLLRESLGQQLQVDYKTSEADLVTEMDRKIEQFFVQKISEAYPHHRIIGEEGMASAGQSVDPAQEIVWLIDPIDGTTSFVHQRENFAVSAAVYENGQARIGIVYDPIKNELFHALHGQGAYMNEQRLEPVNHTSVRQSLIGINSLWLIANDYGDHTKLHSLVRHLRGTRIIGSAALEMTAIACGRLNGFICWKLSPWDFAAALIILEEAGCTVSSMDGSPVNLFGSSSILAANEQLHDEVLTQYLQAINE